MTRGLPLDRFDLAPETVRARFEWAVRQGNPKWLWPDTTVAGWRTALSGIEQATRIILGEGRRATLEGEPDDTGIAAFTSGMGPLLGYWAGAGLLDTTPAVAAVLRLHYWHNARRMEHLTPYAITAVEALAEAGLRVTVLKGMHTAHAFFPDPATRPLSDIDLLIEPAEEPVAAKILGRLGYLPEVASCGEQSWRLSGTPQEPRSLSLVHCGNPWNIDLHTALDRRYSPGAPTVELDKSLGERVPLPWLLSSTAEVLPLPELTLHLACHTGRGFVSTTMLRLTELILVVRHVEDDAPFWDRFLTLAERTGVMSSAYPALRIANDLVPNTVPQVVLQTLERRASRAVRSILRRLTPATCHRVHGCSLRERFMWIRSLRGWFREILLDLFPPLGAREAFNVYKMRFWRLARGQVTP